MNEESNGGPETGALQEAAAAYEVGEPASPAHPPIVGKEREMKWWPSPDGIGITARPFLTIAAAEFKAKCLALMDDIEAYGGEITVTKRGKPVAKLVPYEPPPIPDLRGSVLWVDDDAIVASHPEWWADSVWGESQRESP